VANRVRFECIHHVKDARNRHQLDDHKEEKQKGYKWEDVCLSQDLCPRARSEGLECLESPMRSIVTL
jgi:hypothetical protein